MAVTIYLRICLGCTPNIGDKVDCIAEVECPATIISIMRVMIMSASGLLRGNYGLGSRGMSSVLVVYGMIIGPGTADCGVMCAANRSVVALMSVL